MFFTVCFRVGWYSFLTSSTFSLTAIQGQNRTKQSRDGYEYTRRGCRLSSVCYSKTYYIRPIRTLSNECPQAIAMPSARTHTHETTPSGSRRRLPIARGDEMPSRSCFFLSCARWREGAQSKYHRHDGGSILVLCKASAMKVVFAVLQASWGNGVVEQCTDISYEVWRCTVGIQS
jgi:hypothetical protein